jgi:hypothetical protein
MLVEADTVHQYDYSVLIVVIIFLGAFFRSLLTMGTVQQMPKTNSGVEVCRGCSRCQSSLITILDLMTKRPCHLLPLYLYLYIYSSVKFNKYLTNLYLAIPYISHY